MYVELYIELALNISATTEAAILNANTTFRLKQIIYNSVSEALITTDYLL